METIDIAGLGYQDWLKLRLRGVGGSESSALLGMNKWLTPLSLYEKKLGAPQDDPTAIMRIGTVLEDLVRQMYDEREGSKTEKPIKMFVDVENHMVANVDGITNDGKILECKTVRNWKEWGEEGSDDVPDYYAIQVQHYLGVTGYKAADLAALNVSTGEFRVYRIARSEPIIVTLRNVCKDFWENHVLKGIPPAPMSYKETIRIYRPTGQGEAQGSESDLLACKRLLEIGTAIDALKEEEEILKSDLVKSMAGNAKLVFEGIQLCAFSPVKGRESLDAKALKAAHPDIYSKFMKVSAPSARFTVKFKE